MESFSVVSVLDIASKFGTVGIIIFLWWHSDRRYGEVLRRYKEDMDEQRRMYESNVSLVNDYHSIARDLSEVVIMATQTMATLTTEVRTNQYCPMVRIEKTKIVRGIEG